MTLHGLVGQRSGPRRLFARTPLQGDRRAELAVHLDGNLHRVRRKFLGIERRPRTVIEQARLAAKLLPQFLRQVGGDGTKHDHHRSDFVQSGHPAPGPKRVQELHQGSDRRIERKTGEVIRGLADRPVNGALHGRVRESGHPLLHGGFHGISQPGEEPLRSDDTAVPEVATFLVRPEEHQVRAEGVRPIPLDVFVRVDDVAFRLGHLRAIPNDQPVLPEAHVRLLERNVAEVVQRHGDEPRVQEVQHRVLLPTDVHVHRKPAVRTRRIGRSVVEVRARIPQEIPRAIEERVGYVGFPTRFASAGRTCGKVERCVLGERGDSVVPRLEVLQVRQYDRKVLLGHRDRPARIAVQDRNRRAPVALARDAPVVEAVVHPGFGEPALSQPVNDLRRAFGRQEAAELAGVDQALVLGMLHEGLLAEIQLDGRRVCHTVEHVGRSHDRQDLQPELAGEFEVPLIVPGDGHDRASAVLHQDVVGDPHRDVLSGRRIHRVTAREHTRLGPIVGLPSFHHVDRRGRRPVRLDLGTPIRRGEILDERMLRRQDHERGSEDRVGSGCEHLQRVVTVARHEESEESTLRATDPVPLRRQGGRRPIDPVEVREKSFDEFRDPEEPLAEKALPDLGAAALAFSALHLLVGQDGLA